MKKSNSVSDVQTSLFVDSKTKDVSVASKIVSFPVGAKDSHLDVVRRRLDASGVFSSNSFTNSKNKK